MTKLNEFGRYYEQDRMESIVRGWKYTMVFYPGYLQMYRVSKYTNKIWTTQIIGNMFQQFTDVFVAKDQIGFNNLCKKISDESEQKRRNKELSIRKQNISMQVSNLIGEFINVEENLTTLLY